MFCYYDITYSLPPRHFCNTYFIKSSTLISRAFATFLAFLVSGFCFLRLHFDKRVIGDIGQSRQLFSCESPLASLNRFILFDKFWLVDILPVKD